MPIPNVIERLGRAIFESPFGANRIAKDAPELAEIRLAVLDAVKAKSHRVGGRNVFPFDLIRLRLLGIPQEQAAVLGGNSSLAISLTRSRRAWRVPVFASRRICSWRSIPARTFL